MSDLPKEVILCEEGAREGFQMEKTNIPTDDKLRLIDELSETGLKEITVTSFVHPKWVPQHADAEDVAARFKRRPGVWYTCLTMNAKGVERAHATGRFDDVGGLFIMATESMSKRNTNKTVAEAISDLRVWAEAVKKYDYPISGAGMGNGFGCNIEGDVPLERILWILRSELEMCDELGLQVKTIGMGDTVGSANPLQATRVLAAVKEAFPDIELRVHFHDTRGMGLANVYAALQLGVRHIDTSIGGLGGCPYAPGAAGNVPTEDVAIMCEEMGIKTGLDIDRLLECAILAESIVGHPLPGKAKVGGRVKH